MSEGAARLVTAPVADLLRAPDGSRDRQLQMGEAFDVERKNGAWFWGRAARDGYPGCIAAHLLAEEKSPTHRVAVRATHLYDAPDFKTRERASLGFGAELCVEVEHKKWFECSQGFVPKSHLRPAHRPFSDPVTVAQLFFGTPYLWGGNSVFGIDCSGLVQAGLLACGVACPGDSGPQCEALGTPIALSDVRRGDLVFWPGHVAWVVDPETILHANAHHMAVAYERLSAAVLRIEAQGGGAVSAVKRL
ncbi:MAG: NlpC/P60 family protein [Pseudomonadota bacterium]